jgi:hypothetical protein
MIRRIGLIYEALEQKRKKLNLTEEALTEGICSVRTYRRYIYEDTEMPFHMLEKLVNKLNTNIFDFLYFIEHGIKMDHWDEVLLLDALIQDQYDKALKMYQTFKEKRKKITVHPFLLPIMLEKLKAYENKTSYDVVHTHMIQTLKLDVLMKRPFLTVDHIKLMEHVLPFSNASDTHKMDMIITRIIEGSMILIRASKYTLIKCHQLHFQIAISTKDIQTQIDIFLETLKAIYVLGGELAIDEIMLQAKLARLHEANDNLKDIFSKYYFASSFMYHAQDPFEDEEDTNYLKAMDLDVLVSPHALFEDII